MFVNALRGRVALSLPQALIQVDFIPADYRGPGAWPAEYRVAVRLNLNSVLPVEDPLNRYRSLRGREFDMRRSAIGQETNWRPAAKWLLRGGSSWHCSDAEWEELRPALSHKASIHLLTRERLDAVLQGFVLKPPWDTVPGSFGEHLLTRELVDALASSGAFGPLFTVLRRTRGES